MTEVIESADALSPIVAESRKSEKEKRSGPEPSPEPAGSCQQPRCELVYVRVCLWLCECVRIHIMRKVLGVCALAGCEQKVPERGLAQPFPVACTKKFIAAFRNLSVICGTVQI